MERTITIDTVHGPMQTFTAAPEQAEPAPALVVVQEGFGVNNHIRNVCRRVAAAGYVAFAPELFHRIGAGVDLPYDDLTKVMPAFVTLTNAGLLTDITAAVRAARADQRVDSLRVGIIGFCVGGFAAVLAAEHTDVNAAVAFYGGGIVHARPGIALTPLLDDVEHIQSPLLLVFGGDDQSIPPADIDAIQARLADANKPHTIVVMPEGGHGFACDERAAYHQPSSDEAWRITFEWLHRHLGDANP